MYLYPIVYGSYLSSVQSDTVRTFYQTITAQTSEEQPTETIGEKTEVAADVPYAELLKAAQDYNDSLYSTEQCLLNSSAAYEDAGFDLSPYDLVSDVFAILKISSIELEMPVYLGANQENLANGAAVMGQTSLPIGGVNSNCVIAGHRSWRGADYFLYIPNVKVGDTVEIVNYWGTLHYTVRSCKTIRSSDFTDITIAPGEDRLTLFTCDYGTDGIKYRYLIICERTDG